MTTSTQQITTGGELFCHIGTGWADFTDCVGQCHSFGYQSRQRYFAEYDVDPSNPLCGDITCAVSVVDDQVCTSSSESACEDYAIKFGLSITAESYESANAQIFPLQIALADAIQVTLKVYFMNFYYYIN